MKMDHQPRILSWNINGVRTQKNNFKQLLDSLEADIICLQETKVTRDQLEESVALVDGYYSFSSFSRKRTGYSGVVTFCKKEATPTFAQEGLSGSLDVGFLDNQCGKSESLPGIWDNKDLKDLDAEGRCIITQHPFRDGKGEEKTLALINVYCPRADPEKPERAVFKITFYELLRQRAFVLRESGAHVVILGDINTAHKRMDRCDSDEYEDFDSSDDRLFLNQFLLDRCSETRSDSCDDPQGLTDEPGREVPSNAFKVVDTFRVFHPDQRDAFTCWNTRVNARSTNYGSRIDYLLCDEGFLPYVKDSFIHSDVLGSDHCPVSVTLSRFYWLPADSIPPMCTKFYSEFHGNQQKLSSYFKSSTEPRTLTDGNSSESNVEGNRCLTNRKTDDKSVSNCTTTQCSKRKMNEKCVNSKSCKKKSVSGNSKQSTLNFYFIKEEKSPIKRNSSNSSSLNSESSTVHKNIEHVGIVDPQFVSMTKDSKESSVDTTSKLIEYEENRKVHNSDSTITSSWSFLMKGPAPPPLCPGHKEPSVLRTVKRKGPNLNKQFYSCARGFGREGDPNAACKFFQWLGKKPR